MTYVNKTLAALLVLAVGYLVYSVFELRRELFMVYDVSDKYAYGSDDADLIIVDFYKYGCENCRVLHPVLMEAIRKDGKVRYVSRPVTYGHEWENVLVAAVYAAAEQGKFNQLHDVLNAKWPVNNRKTLFSYAKAIGLDTKQLSRDMTKSDITDHVSENQRFFDAWRLNRTPTFIMGEKAIYAPKIKNLTVDDFLKKFEEARS